MGRPHVARRVSGRSPTTTPSPEPDAETPSTSGSPRRVFEFVGSFHCAAPGVSTRGAALAAQPFGSWESLAHVLQRGHAGLLALVQGPPPPPPPAAPASRARLLTVQDFYAYTEEQSKTFFSELDRDSDGWVGRPDVVAALRRRGLPDRYAAAFLDAAKGGRWWTNAVSWEQFKALLDEREPDVLRAFTALEMDAAGRLAPHDIQHSLRKLGLPAGEDECRAMLAAVGGAEDGFVSYGRFRAFAALLPPAAARSPSSLHTAWFESATMVPIGPPSQAPVGDVRTISPRTVLIAALAGAMASSATTLTMHPIDTLKTRLQSVPGARGADVPVWLRTLGARGLYRGVVPAVTGAALGHGLRMSAYEAALALLLTLTGGGAEAQMTGIASGLGTLVGTSCKIPCEVAKQRLQVGMHDNVVEAFVAAVRAEGARGLFRGTAATLLREVPLYGFGMATYAQLKKVFTGEAFGAAPPRKLTRGQTLATGALAGAFAAVLTTPADVLKTRIMTAGLGSNLSPVAVLADIVRKEGVLALYRGWLPRVFWIAPLGAMNFAGYELARNALAASSSSSSSSSSDKDAAADGSASGGSGSAGGGASASDGGGSSGGGAQQQQLRPQAGALPTDASGLQGWSGVAAAAAPDSGTGSSKNLLLPLSGLRAPALPAAAAAATAGGGVTDAAVVSVPNCAAPATSGGGGGSSSDSSSSSSSSSISSFTLPSWPFGARAASKACGRATPAIVGTTTAAPANTGSAASNLLPPVPVRPPSHSALTASSTVSSGGLLRLPGPAGGSSSTVSASTSSSSGSSSAVPLALPAPPPLPPGTVSAASNLRAHAKPLRISTKEDS